VGEITEGEVAAVEKKVFGAVRQTVTVAFVQLLQLALVRRGIGGVVLSVYRILGNQGGQDGVNHRLGVGKVEPDVRVHPLTGMLFVTASVFHLMPGPQKTDSLAGVDHQSLPGIEPVGDAHGPRFHVTVRKDEEIRLICPDDIVRFWFEAVCFHAGWEQ